MYQVTLFRKIDYTMWMQITLHIGLKDRTLKLNWICLSFLYRIHFRTQTFVSHRNLIGMIPKFNLILVQKWMNFLSSCFQIILFDTNILLTWFFGIILILNSRHASQRIFVIYYSSYIIILFRYSFRCIFSS